LNERLLGRIGKNGERKPLPALGALGLVFSRLGVLHHHAVLAVGTMERHLTILKRDSSEWKRRICAAALRCPCEEGKDEYEFATNRRLRWRY